MPHDCSVTMSPGRTYVFDARGVDRRFRHAAIFGALHTLLPGESMRFCNDHDPVPLLNEIEDVFGERVNVIYHRRAVGDVVIDFKLRA
ncbi:DUF2249 domain-containing protein [Massilia sp. X63]|uniref:DUF2249 domain-containing protein n=1 Tax=Massilia sp. X63 TaxID=3237285 RepID=UPI0034DD6075